MTGRCFICGKWGPLERHHVYTGSNRKKSERYGYVVNLCHDCHNEPPGGVHHNAENMLKMKQQFQRIHEQTYSREHFIQTFGKNYLDD